MKDDKAFSILVNEYSSIPPVGGRTRFTESVHACIRYEFKEIFPAIARGESSCDCRKDLIAGLAERFGRDRSTIERVVKISTVLSSSAIELS